MPFEEPHPGEPRAAHPATDDPATPSSVPADRSVGSWSEAVHSKSPEILAAVAGDPALTENLALVLLKRTDLPAQAVAQLSKNGALLTSRKVKLAVVEHPRTPRHVSMPMVRHLFTFDLMQVALAPMVPADIKMAAEASLIHRLERLPQGERLSLAHRASGRVAAELLLDPEARVIQAALENPRLTESAVAKALTRHDAPAALLAAICHDSRWSARREIGIALLRHEATPLDRALEIARALPGELVREVLRDSCLSEASKERLVNDIEERSEDRGKNAF